MLLGLLSIVLISLGVMSWRGVSELDRLIDRDLESLVIAYETDGLSGLEAEMDRMRDYRFALLPDFDGHIVTDSEDDLPLDETRSDRGFVSISPDGETLRARAIRFDPETAVITGRSLSPLKRDMAVLSLVLVLCASLSLALGWLSMRSRKRQIERRVADLSGAMYAVRQTGEVEPLPRSGRQDELDRIADAAEDMARDLSRRATHHREFSEQLAHELRTPLARLAAELPDASEDRDELEETERIRRQITSVSKALGDMLDLAAIRNEIGRPVMRETGQAEPILQETLELFQDVAEDRGISFDLDLVADPGFGVQPGLFRRLSVNLIDNAISNSPEKSPVSVTHNPAKGLVLRVANSGDGFPDDLLEKGPSRFGRYSRLVSGQMSTGLGLAFADAIAEAHGWTLQLQNVDGLAVVEIRVASRMADQRPT